jgi:hypothetical protein
MSAIKFHTKPFGNLFKQFLFWSLLFGIIFFVLGYGEFDWVNNMFESIFKAISSILLSGGVFMFLAKSYQFNNIFKDELRKVIFADEHLDQRADLDDIWEKVSEAICRRKFSSISKKLQNNIKDFYLPVNQDFYFKDYNYDIDISYKEHEKNYINLKETTEAEIISHDKEKLVYKFKSKIPKPENDNDLTQYSLEDVFINNNKIDIKNDPKANFNIIDKDDFLSVNFSYELKGSLTYTVKKIENKTYNTKCNPYKGHEAAWIYQNFFLDVTYPKDMPMELINMGVLSNFNVDNRNLKDVNRMKAKYSGLIFPKQGFLLIFNKQ